jgi:L-lactate dehydrogenase (cytochrome)
VSAVENKSADTLNVEPAQAAAPVPQRNPAGTWERDPGIPRRLRHILALEDFEPEARKVLPRSIFGFVSGGVETNSSLSANRAAFGTYSFRTRVLRNVAKRSTATTLFGESYNAPFGIAPMGASGLCGLHADFAFARAARAAHIPFVLSGASILSMERVRQENQSAWFQAYFQNSREAIEALTDRVANAGYGTLVVTVDVPVAGNRENNVRTGYTSPLRPTARLTYDALTHPRWLFGTACRTVWDEGMPHFQNFQPGVGAPVFSTTAQRPQLRDALSWDDIAFVRKRWKGTLVIKGILAGEDAARAREAGIDGVIVSNHGGRQLDGAVAPLLVLPEIVAKAGDMTVMVDSGVRRGTDVLKALALGAKFVFVGRPFLYAATIGGERAVRHAIDILAQEVNRDLALLGCRSPAEVTRDHLYPAA